MERYRTRPSPGKSFSARADSTRSVLSLNGVRAGSFSVPVTGLGITGTLRYEIRVTAVDSDGISAMTSRTLDPDEVALTIDTAPRGLIINLDGTPSATPLAVDTLIGYEHVIAAPNAGAGNQVYVFDAWSDGGDQAHTIRVPALPTSFVATYTASALEPDQDQDGDGLLNGFEILFGFDPFDPSDAALDSDGDSLTNLEEQALGTDPTQADPDGDGLTDAQELAIGTDPNDPDSDADTFSDGEEVAAGTDPLDSMSFPDESDPSLLVWYTFASDGAGVVNDASGNGNDASCTPGGTCPTFSAGDGRPPGAYDFAGNGNYVEFPNESSFDFTTQFSVSLWMKLQLRQSVGPAHRKGRLGLGDRASDVVEQAVLHYVRTVPRQHGRFDERVRRAVAPHRGGL